MLRHVMKLLAGASLLLQVASALPPLATLVIEARYAEATDAWVTVDPLGTPVTVTPVVTVVAGNTTTISAIPNELTATVVTKTYYGEVSTSTGTAPVEATATNSNGAGSFLACKNAGGINAPFCQPTAGSSLYPGNTYYITWDPSVFPANTTVMVVGFYAATTTDETSSQAFSSNKIQAGRSYYAWAVDSKLLQDGRAVNITLHLEALATDQGTPTKSYTGPTVVVTKTPTYHQPPPKMPTGAALYIGLPTILGFCVLMIFGVCLWNRQTRRVDLGDIMSRSRRTYGLAKSRARRVRRRDKRQAVQLTDQVPEDRYYRDELQSRAEPADDAGWDHQHVYGYRDDDNGKEYVGQGRRDSDALGSLAETLTGEHSPPRRQQQHGNAFEDELERQQRERSQEDRPHSKLAC